MPKTRIHKNIYFLIIPRKGDKGKGGRGDRIQGDSRNTRYWVLIDSLRVGFRGVGLQRSERGSFTGLKSGLTGSLIKGWPTADRQTGRPENVSSCVCLRVDDWSIISKELDLKGGTGGDWSHKKMSQGLGSGSGSSVRRFLPCRPVHPKFTEYLLSDNGCQGIVFIDLLNDKNYLLTSLRSRSIIFSMSRPTRTPPPTVENTRFLASRLGDPLSLSPAHINFFPEFFMLFSINFSMLFSLGTKEIIDMAKDMANYMALRRFHDARAA